MESHQPNLQRGWAKPWVFSQSTQTLFGIFLGGQFFCMFWERFIDLGILCWALVFGLILGVVWGPKDGQPHGGWDGWWMGFSVVLLWGGWLWFVFHMLPLHKPESFRLVSTVWTVSEHGACRRDWGLGSPNSQTAKQRYC